MEEISLGDINLRDIGDSIQIEGTIWSGNGISFITLFPDKKPDFGELKLLPMSLEDWQAFLQQADTREIEILHHGPHGIVKSLIRKSERQISGYVQWSVFRRDSYTCRYCGRTGIPLTVDHIDLWENRGATVEANLVSACRDCNKTRGRTPYAEWLESAPYKKRSSNLSEEVKQLNAALIHELPRLEALRVKNVRTR